MKKKILAVFLSLCMAMSLLPITALATEGTDAPNTQTTSLPDAGEDGVIELTGDVTIDSLDLNETGATTIDLKGYKLTCTWKQGLVIGEGQTLTFKDTSVSGAERGGNLVFNGVTSTTAAIAPEAGGTVNVSNLKVTCSGSAFFPAGDAAAVNITNCDVTASVYCVGTNAGSNTNYNVEITLKDSTFTADAGDGDNCPVMINVPGTLSMENCEVTGDRMGVLVRAGEATISNCTIRATGEYDDKHDYEGSEAWGSGNEVPMAAIIVGSQTSAYKANATCEITDTTINAPTDNSKPAVYVSSNKAGGYSSQLTISGKKTTIAGNVVVADGSATTPAAVVITDKATVTGNITNKSSVSSIAVTGGAKLSGNVEATENSGPVYVEGDENSSTGVAMNEMTRLLYKDLNSAINAAKGKETIKLLKNVNLTEALTIEKGITIDGNRFAISYTDSDLINGAFITVQGENGDNVTLKSLTVNTNGKAKHGVQFYCVTGGKLDNVTVNGGSYTSVIVNGSEVTLTDCTLNPADGAYANVEYAMGEGVTEIPKITLSNVTTSSTTVPFVYADKGTANRLNDQSDKIDENATAEDIANAINQEYLTGAEITLNYDGTPVVVGTSAYTITFNLNGHGEGQTVPASMQTNSAGQLPEQLPTLQNDGRYRFDGWFTAAIGGEQVSQNTVFTGSTTLYAHWTYMAPPANPNYKITIDDAANGTVTADPAAAKAGATVTLTATPDEGYAVGTITVTDRFGDAVKVTENADGTYTFTMPNGQVTVKATFVETEEPAPAEPFPDVDENDWFYDEVVYVYENGLMNGVENNQFAPNTATNRAMLATILYRLAGEPAVSGDLPFTDVAAGTWYTDAVLWAAQNGIVNGLGENTFAPMNTLTREQLVTMLYRYAEAAGYDVSAAADLSGYPDAGKVQTYAQKAMSWAVAEGIVEGMDGNLNPAGNATRAQIATILMRFCEGVAK